MATEVIMPALGMAQDTGKILRWFKSEGDTVAKGEPLLEIETDKVTVEVEAPGDGTLAGVRAGEGDEVPVGDVVAFLLAAGERVPEIPPSVEPEPATIPAPSKPNKVSLGGEGARRPLASPKARRLAKERGIDLDSLAGDGPIVAADLEHAPSRTGTSSRESCRRRSIGGFTASSSWAGDQPEANAEGWLRCGCRGHYPTICSSESTLSPRSIGSPVPFRPVFGSIVRPERRLRSSNASGWLGGDLGTEGSATPAGSRKHS